MKNVGRVMACVGVSQDTTSHRVFIVLNVLKTVWNPALEL